MKKEIKIAHLKMSIGMTEGRIKRDTEVKKKLIDELTEFCDHPQSECVEYYDNSANHSGSSGNVPIRVCKICGYGEKGWNFLGGKLNYNYSSDIAHRPFSKWSEFAKKIVCKTNNSNYDEDVVDYY